MDLSRPVSSDEALVVALACSLDEKPGSNWVQEEGGLPEFICEMARAIKREGKSTSSAIAIAVGRVKQLAAKGNAKAAKAAAQWERLKAKSHEKVSATNNTELAPDEANLEELMAHCIGRHKIEKHASLNRVVGLARKE